MADSRQVFPATRRTWLGDRLGDDDGRHEAIRYVMEVYTWPLQVYFRGTRWRGAGEPADVVHGFLADRLAQPGYLDAWHNSDIPLHRWLANGLCFYLRERWRAAARETRVGELPAGLSSEDPGPLEALDRAFAISVARRAMEHAATSCRSEGLEHHWSLFVRHHYEGMPYRDLAVSSGVPPERAAVMVRTATKRFRAALRELLGRDGVPPERIEHAIVELLATCER
ncbi:MAG: hypothetical protein AAF628_18450 [Planctomycetota bacterium]